MAGVTTTFNATATAITFSGITPATLTLGASATITGQGFGATIAAASPSSLEITVPFLPCGNAHN